MPKYPEFSLLSDAEIQRMIKIFYFASSREDQMRILHALKTRTMPTILDPRAIYPGIRELFDELYHRGELPPQPAGDSIQLTGDPRLSSDIIRDIKIATPPAISKHVTEIDYSSNFYSECDKYTLIWLFAHMKAHAMNLSAWDSLFSTHPSHLFYKATSTAVIPPPISEPQISFKLEMRSRWFDQLKRYALLPPGAESPRYIWNCDQVLQQPPGGICFTTSRDFSEKIAAIISAMENAGNNINLAVYIGSKDVNHAMGLIIKIKPAGYISVIFFEPNTLQGQRKIALSRGERASWLPRLNELIQSSTLPEYIRRFGILDPDLTLLCFVLGHTHQPIQFPADSLELDAMSIAKYIYNIIQAGGGSPPYLHKIREIFTHYPHINPCNYHDHQGSTSLLFAACEGYTEIVEELVAHVTPQQLNEPRHLDRLTPIFAAAHEGNADVVAILVRYIPREQWNMPSLGGLTPLQAARQYDNPERRDEYQRIIAMLQ